MNEEEYPDPLYFELSGFGRYVVISHAIAHLSMSVLFDEECGVVGVVYVVLYEEAGFFFAYCACFGSEQLRCLIFICRLSDAVLA